MQERIESATDETIKPETLYNPNHGTQDDSIAIGSLGENGVFNQGNTDGDFIGHDRSSLFIYCRLGPDSAGDYTEDILSMLEYEMNCK